MTTAVVAVLVSLITTVGTITAAQLAVSAERWRVRNERERAAAEQAAQRHRERHQRLADGLAAAQGEVIDFGIVARALLESRRDGLAPLDGQTRSDLLNRARTGYGTASTTIARLRAAGPPSAREAIDALDATAGRLFGYIGAVSVRDIDPASAEQELRAALRTVEDALHEGLHEEPPPTEPEIAPTPRRALPWRRPADPR
ncbi:hypothetical protein [Actinomadura hibisca]|uniref:hypothetical protein n=1 Tax=Actinomadura hibisca TaxID=68565 RepID=UPI000834D08C|nr:hypothetical protein [Actinomadura hibisca]